MTLAILGAGSVGAALAANLASKGLAARVGVRDPGSDRHAALRAGKVDVLSLEAAVQTADTLILATPWPATLEIVKGMKGLPGKTLIDATNPVAFGPAGMRVLPTPAGSAAREIAAIAPDAYVFKSFNQVGANVMAAPASAAVTPIMFVAGDDATRKPAVLSLVADLGFDARDAGGLDAAAWLEALAFLWIGQAMRGPMGRNFAFAAAPWKPAG